MNSNQILKMALDLDKPWYVSKIDMVKPTELLQGQIDIFLDFEKGFKFPGGKQPHDTVERTWQNLNFFQYTYFLHALVPRI
jgi:transposase